MAGVVDQCVEDLGRCLDLVGAPAAHEALLRDVFAVYRWDALDKGGYGMDEAPRKVLLEKTTMEERQVIATWVIEADVGDVKGSLAELAGLTGAAWNSAALDVASAIKDSHPSVAANLYRRLIDALVAHGTKAARTQAEAIRLRLRDLDSGSAH